MAVTEAGIRILILGVGEARRQSAQVQKDLNDLNKAIKDVKSSSFNLGDALVGVGNQLQSIGRTLTLTLTTPITIIGGSLVTAGIKFEDSFAGVAKTVDGVSIGFKDLVKNQLRYQLEAMDIIDATGKMTGRWITMDEAIDQVILTMSDAEKESIFASEGFGQLTDVGIEIREEFRKLSMEIPISVNELARIGQIGGQLGVPADQIVGFTETVALLGETTDLSSEDAAFAIARFANIMGIESGNLAYFAEHAGSAIVALGNNAAATEPEILKMALRMAGVGRMAGVSETEILGIAATIAEVGVASEKGGTAINRIFLEMLTAIGNAGEELDLFAMVSGKTAEQFASDFKYEPVEALMDFLPLLSEMQEQGALTDEQMTAMGLGGIRVKEVLGLLGPNMELLTENIDRANLSWGQNIAMQEEATRKFATVGSQITILKNIIANLGTTIFLLYREDIKKLIVGIGELVQKFEDLDVGTKRNIVKFALLAAAAGPAILVIGTLLTNLGVLINTLSLLGTGLVKLWPFLTKISPMLGGISRLGSVLVSSLSPLLSLIPYLTIGLGIAVSLITAYLTNAFGFADKVNALGDALRSGNIMDILKAFWEAIIAIPVGLAKKLDEMLGISDMLSDIDTSKLLEDAKNLGNKILDGIGAAFSDLVSWVNENILTPIINAILGIDLGAVLAGAIDIGISILNAIGDAFSDLVSWVNDTIFVPIRDAILGIDLSGLAEGAIGIATGILNFIKEGFSSIGTWINDNLISPIADGIANFEIANLSFEAGRLVRRIFEWMVAAVGDVSAWVLDNIINPIVNAIAGFDVNELVAKAARIGVLILSGVQDAFDNMLAWVGENILVPLADAIVNLDLSKLITDAKTIGAQILVGIASAFLSLPFWLYTKVLLPLGAAIINADYGQLLTDAKEIGLKILIGIGNAFLSVTDWILENIILPFAQGLMGEEQLSEIDVSSTAIGEAILTAIGGVFTDIVNWVYDNIILKISSAIESVDFSVILEAAKGIGSSIIEGIVEGIKSAPNAIWDALKSSAGSAGGIFSSIVDSLVPDENQFGGRINGLSWVGEAGPELFIPDRSGFIVSNMAFRRVLSDLVNPTPNIQTTNNNTSVYSPQFQGVPTMEQRQSNLSLWTEYLNSRQGAMA